MNARIPCGLEDYRCRFEPEDTEEDTDPRTEVEKRISWICDEWADAQACDTFDEWSGQCH